MAENVEVEKRYDNRMWIITLHDGSRKGVDVWEQTVRDYIAAFNNAPERYLVYDTSPIPNMGFTNYLQQRATVLAKDNRDATGRVGIVLRVPTMMIYFFDVFVRITGRRIQPDLDVKLFSQREEAIAWVEEIVPDNA